MQRLSEIQAAIGAEGLAGWLLYEFRGLNPIALDVLGIPAARSGSRRWACFIPAQGEPRWLVHAIELGGWQSVVPDAMSYVSWADWREGSAHDPGRHATRGDGGVAGRGHPVYQPGGRRHG